MSTPIVTARRNLGAAHLEPAAQGREWRDQSVAWQLCEVRGAIEQLEEERFAEGERTMSEAERHDLYEPVGYIAKEPIERRQLVDQLAAVVAAA